MTTLPGILSIVSSGLDQHSDGPYLGPSCLQHQVTASKESVNIVFHHIFNLKRTILIEVIKCVVKNLLDKKAGTRIVLFLW